MILLTCPNCGGRNLSEFRYGGEHNPRPDEHGQTNPAEWTDYLYLRTNSMAEQVEWWYHRAGCELWFLATRHRHTNRVTRTYSWGEDR